MGKASKRTAGRIVRASICVCVLLSYLGAVTEVAHADLVSPDTLQIESANVYRHLLETDDYLVVLHYDIHYINPVDQPDDPASDTFIVRLRNAAGNDTLGATTPYPFYNDGYDEGCASLYWPASTAPTWTGNHTICLDGNPLQFDSPPTTSKILSSADYTGETEQEDIQDELKAYILDIAASLETDWGMAGDLMTYTQAGLVLSATGEAYFAGAVPGLRSFCPELFTLQIVAPTVTEETFTQAQADEFNTRFDDTPVEGFVDGLGGFFGDAISGQLVTTMLVMAGMIAVVILVAIKFGKATPGFLIGYPLILIATPMGFFSFPLLGVITLMCILVLGYLWFMKPASG